MPVAAIIGKKKKIALIGLGYVGLPIALAFAKKASVIGFDINTSRINLLKRAIDPSKQLGKADFEGCDIEFTDSLEVLREASFFIITVPTPVDYYHIPDITSLLKATETVGKVLKKGDYVVYESTVYPGCTEEDCLPVLERISGLKLGTDFKLGYSPERINPGDKLHTLETIIKVVSGTDEASLEVIAAVYGLVIKAGIYKAPSIKVAEAAKILENTQRDLNIGLMNELSIIFEKMNINTYEVLAAAGTKWNFLHFSPGLVGGHCIGVDPYYLTYKAAKLGYSSQVITAGRTINDGMGKYVAERVLIHLLKHTDNVRNAKVLIMGATFKENVTDIRNSRVADLVKAFQSYHLQADISDPYADSAELLAEYGFSLTDKLATDYDAVIITVAHKEYLTFDDSYFKTITRENALVADIKGLYLHKIISRNYWSL